MFAQPATNVRNQISVINCISICPGRSSQTNLEKEKGCKVHYVQGISFTHMFIAFASHRLIAPTSDSAISDEGFAKTPSNCQALQPSIARTVL